MENNNKYATKPFIPKTETRIILENKEPTKLTKFFNYLGLSKVYACNENPCRCVNYFSNTSRIVASPSTRAEIIASAMRAARQYGGEVGIKENGDGSVTIVYPHTFNARLWTLGDFYFYTESNSIERRGYTCWERAFNRIFQTGDLFKASTLKMHDVNEAREYHSDLIYNRIYISYPGHGLFNTSPQPDSGKTNQALYHLNSWVSEYEHGNNVDKSAGV